ncbi:MAG: glycosyltransferase family 4 protein [Thermoguttaceae bacterium]|nr:glycosyltransferase family 4 protein [Thermoguttaceae bacterium]MDW8077858.1 glycosyltransferase family 4 protein [Thermoguttaceae bacterium]
MHLVALTEAVDHVCYRYRVRPFEKPLADAGVVVHVQPLARGPFRRLRQLRQLRQAAGVLLQRKLLPPWEIALLRRYARVLIYDVDDAVFQRDSFQPKSPQSSYRRLRFRMTVAAADLVFAGNNYLASHVRRIQRRLHKKDGKSSTAPGLLLSRRCLTVPTCVDPAKYPVALHGQKDQHLRLVWIGSSSTLPSLECAAEHLRAIAKQIPTTVLRVVCDRLPCLGGIALELWPWSEDSEGQALATADIGIAWMPPDSWSRGKCGLKVLQYMAAGLPVVANPVGVHLQMVLPGKTGLLAQTPAEWAESIRQLAANPSWRNSLGRHARSLVQTSYSPAYWAPVVTSAIVNTLRARLGKDAENFPESKPPLSWPTPWFDDTDPAYHGERCASAGGLTGPSLHSRGRSLP